MLKFLFFITTVVGISAMAQVSSAPDNVDPSRADLRSLNQNGGLISIRLEPKQPVSLYIVGREEAKIDFSKLKVVIRRLSPGQKEVLHSHQEGNRYIIEEPLDLEKPGEIEVTAKMPKKVETFHFKISNIPR